MLFILLMLASKETKKISLNPNGETEVQQPLFFFFKYCHRAIILQSGTPGRRRNWGRAFFP